MVESGTQTTIYQNSYGQDAFSTVLNAAACKAIKKEVVDTVYGMSDKPISPVVALMAGDANENITELGQKLIWVTNKTIPTTTSAPFRGAINPVYDDNWSDRLEMGVGVLRTDICIDKALYDMFISGSTALVDAYPSFIKRFSTSHQEALVRRFYGDGVQSYDGVSGSTGLVNLTSEANALEITGFGYPVESASRTNAILATGNTYAGKDRSAGANIKYRAKLFDAQSSTSFPTGSPGTFTSPTGLTIAHLMYVANKTYVGNDMCDVALMGIDEWLQLQNLAQIQSIMSNPNGSDPVLRKWGFDHFVVGNVKFVLDRLFARPGQIIFTNFKFTKFYSKVKAELSPVWLQEKDGYKQYYQNIYSVGQMISVQPGCNAVLYNYGL